MNSLLLYDYISTCGVGHTRRVLVIFNSLTPPAPEIYEDRLVEFLAERRIPDVLYFVGQQTDLPVFQALLKSDVLLSRIEGRIGVSTSPEYRFLVFMHKENRYEFFARDGLPLNLPEPKEELNEVRHKGLQHIFITRGGILKGSPAHHYGKPSGKHSDNFIRTANVLVNSAEVTFIAYWLLQHINQSTRRLYCDTSSVNVIGFAVNQLRSFYDRSAQPLTIESFNSYEGLDNFRFHQMRHSLIIISASTSGDLGQKLISRGADSDNIITLFFVGTSTPKHHVLCNLTQSPENRSGIAPINSFASETCPLCKSGSIQVMIFGDQFLPEKPKTEQVRIRKSDAPANLRPFMVEFARKSAFRISRQEKTGRGMFESYLDVERVLSEPKIFPQFHKDLSRILKRAVPASLGNIVHLTDPASEKLARVISGIFAASGSASPTVLPEDEIDKCKLRAQDATIVVAGSASHGRHLMALNRSLRHLQPDGTITYIIGLVRSEGKGAFDEIRSNLTYGDDGPDTFGFHYVRNCYFPLPDSEGGPWMQELDLLKNVIDFCRTADIQVPNIFRERKALLEKGMVNGLVDDIFWPSWCQNEQAQPLEIRENFVFFDTTTGCSSVSQADIYTTISLVLHNLRFGLAGQLPKLHVQHHRRVIAPINFDRFNDGIIQAALLRAAHKHELHYGDEPGLSAQITDIVLDNIRFAGEERGEALFEFLLALAMKKLCLVPEHARNIVEAAQTSVKVPEHYKILVGYIEQTLNN